MDFDIQSVPHPRPLSIILVVSAWVFHLLSDFDHKEINLWLASIAAICAITSYTITFIKWLNSKIKNKTP